MTIKGYGIKLIEFIREKNLKGAVDRQYVGRMLRVVTSDDGGELLLNLRPSEIMKLKEACEVELQGLVYTSAHGWRNTDDPTLPENIAAVERMTKAIQAQAQLNAGQEGNQHGALLH